LPTDYVLIVETDIDPGALAGAVVAARTSLGWTQADVATRAGVDVSVVRKIEQAKARRPAVLTVLKLSRALGVSAEALVSGVTDPGEDPALLARFFAAHSVPREFRSLLRLVARNPPPGRRVDDRYLLGMLALAQGLPVADPGEAADFNRRVSEGLEPPLPLPRK
jgi:transcriptional regulator with XRE-family HTH domain